MERNPQPLRTDFEGKGALGILTEGLNRIGRRLNLLHFAGEGDVMTTEATGIMLRTPPAPACTGVVYVSGTRHTGKVSEQTKPWIKVDIAANTVTEESGPPSFPLPSHQEWYDKAQTFGDIHITRF
jgi:hypothetical protein